MLILHLLDTSTTIPMHPSKYSSCACVSSAELLSTYLSLALDEGKRHRQIQMHARFLIFLAAGEKKIYLHFFGVVYSSLLHCVLCPHTYLRRLVCCLLLPKRDPILSFFCWKKYPLDSCVHGRNFCSYYLSFIYFCSLLLLSAKSQLSHPSNIALFFQDSLLANLICFCVGLLSSIYFCN